MPIAKKQELYLAGDNTTAGRKATHLAQQKTQARKAGSTTGCQLGEMDHSSLKQRFYPVDFNYRRSHIHTGWADENGNTERWQSISLAGKGDSEETPSRKGRKLILKGNDSPRTEIQLFRRGASTVPKGEHQQPRARELTFH